MSNSLIKNDIYCIKKELMKDNENGLYFKFNPIKNHLNFSITEEEKKNFKSHYYLNKTNKSIGEHGIISEYQAIIYDKFHSLINLDKFNKIQILKIKIYDILDVQMLNKIKKLNLTDLSIIKKMIYFYNYSYLPTSLKIFNLEEKINYYSSSSFKYNGLISKMSNNFLKEKIINLPNTCKKIVYSSDRKIYLPYKLKILIIKNLNSVLGKINNLDVLNCYTTNLQKKLKVNKIKIFIPFIESDNNFNFDYETLVLNVKKSESYNFKIKNNINLIINCNCEEYFMRNLMPENLNSLIILNKNFSNIENIIDKYISSSTIINNYDIDIDLIRSKEVEYKKNNILSLHIINLPKRIKYLEVINFDILTLENPNNCKIDYFVTDNNLRSTLFKVSKYIVKYKDEIPYVYDNYLQKKTLFSDLNSLINYFKDIKIIFNLHREIIKELKYSNEINLFL